MPDAQLSPPARRAETIFTNLLPRWDPVVTPVQGGPITFRACCRGNTERSLLLSDSKQGRTSRPREVLNMSARATRLAVPASTATHRELPRIVAMDPAEARRDRIKDHWALVLMVVCSSLFAIGLATRVFWPTVKTVVQAPSHASPEGH